MKKKSCLNFIKLTSTKAQKSFLIASTATFMLASLAGCSTNPATGEQQFTALMSPKQEMQVGATEHSKIMQTYGTVGDSALESYVSSVGQKVAQKTERPDVQYQFFVLDDAMVNAFALPGGYVYVTRGLLAQANSEAELAAVLGHEIGHITGRHSAERYSRGVVTSLGAMVLSAALDSSAASQAIGVGGDLFMKSYSREQENQADSLGLRYMTNTGYHPSAMPAFLTALEGNTALENKMSGTKAQSNSWFATHPITADRIQKTQALAKNYPQSGSIERNAYLNKIDGLIYGDSAKQGFARDNDFYHPGLGFTFSVPDGFQIINQPSQVLAQDKASGTVIVFDAQALGQNMSMAQYISTVWMKEANGTKVENMSVNGMDAATASFSGTVNGKAVNIRIVAVKWDNNRVFRFQFAIPKNASQQLVDGLKRTSYSLRRMTDAEKRDIQPYRVRAIPAGAGDTVSSLAAKMPYKTYKEDRFRALNALMPGQNALTSGQKYKIISER